jgi:hypothetical protein
MSTQALSMPTHVADLILLTLNRLGLRAHTAKDDVITLPLEYEDGSELSLVFVCIAQPRWFLRSRPMLLLSIAELNSDTRAVQIFSRELMPMPVGPDDFRFMTVLSAKVRATVWSIAATAGMGECVSLPGRPEVPG